MQWDSGAWALSFHAAITGHAKPHRGKTSRPPILLRHRYPFTLVQVSPPEACPSRFASFTQSGETKGSRRKALNLITLPTRAEVPK